MAQTPKAKDKDKDPAPSFSGLIGSSIQPAKFTVDGLELTLGDMVAVAHAESGLSADDWNKLTQDDRETRIAGALASIEEEAAAEKRKREATAGLMAARRAEQQPATPLPTAVPMAQVYDTTARAEQVRTHEIVVGRHPNGEPMFKSYGLRSDKPTLMPVDHAMKFLVDKAFRVVGEDGNIITPIEKPEGERANIRLAPDEVIVKLSDLSSSALLKRAKMLPGSEKIGANSRDEEIIDFILESQPRNAVGRSRGSEGIEEDEAAANLVDVRVPVTA
jgi:hypothetical protein